MAAKMMAKGRARRVVLLHAIFEGKNVLDI